MKQSTITYTRRTNARRAGVTAGIPRERLAITVHKDGDDVRFGWKEAAEPTTKVGTTIGEPVPKVAQEERHGIKRPKAGGICASVWAWLDTHPNATLRDAKAQGEKRGWNSNNVSCEFYARRRFYGISRTMASQRTGKHRPR